MKSCINILPINCGFNSSFNDKITFSETEYNSASERKVLVIDPLKSYFKMKSVTKVAYLEPVFFGLDIGDKITIKFKQKTISGDGVVTIQALMQNGNVPLTYTPTSKIASNFFENVEISFYVTDEIKSYSGDELIVNIRATSFGEIILKDIEICVDSSLDLRQDLVIYDSKNKYEKMIANANKTECQTSIYSGIQTIKSSGGISYANDSFVINTTNNTSWKGVYHTLSNCNYSNPVCIFVEFNITDGLELPLTSKHYDSSFTQINSSVQEIKIPTTPATQKKLIYFDGFKNGEYHYVDLGRKSNPFNGTIKKVIICKNRFDNDLNFDKSNVFALC